MVRRSLRVPLPRQIFPRRVYAGDLSAQKNSIDVPLEVHFRAMDELIGTLMALDSSGNITFSTLLGGLPMGGIDAISLDSSGALYPIGATGTQFPGGPIIDSSSGSVVCRFCHLICLSSSGAPRSYPRHRAVSNSERLGRLSRAATAGAIATLFGEQFEALADSDGVQVSNLMPTGWSARKLAGRPLQSAAHRLPCSMLRTRKSTSSCPNRP